MVAMSGLGCTHPETPRVSLHSTHGDVEGVIGAVARPVKEDQRLYGVARKT